MASVRQIGSIAGAISRVQQQIYQTPRTTARAKAEVWPNPLQPIQQTGPAGAQALAWQFYEGQNLNYTPRADAEYSASDLKTLASYPIARWCIENVKDQLSALSWQIQVKPLPGESKKDRALRAKGDPNIISLSNFLEWPDGENDWATWVKPLIDDALVIDAPTILLRRTFADKIAQLRVLRGETIVRYIDEQGYTPGPDKYAYAQTYQGMVYVNLTTDQLVYRPRNIAPRNTVSSQLYGLSPTESAATEIQIGINRLQFVLAYYTNGSIPDVVQVVPGDVDQREIRQSMEWMNSELAGDLARRRNWRMVQGFTEDGKDQIIFPKEKLLSDPFDDLHIRKICFAYGVSPQRLLKQMNRASAESSEDAAEDEGLTPWLTWLKGTVDFIIQKKMGLAGYEISFTLESEKDPLKSAQAAQVRLNSQKSTINEEREKDGDDPRPEPEADQLGTITAMGWQPIEAYVTQQARQDKQDATAAIAAKNPAPVAGNEPKSNPKAPQKAAGSDIKKVTHFPAHTPKIDPDALLPDTEASRAKLNRALKTVFAKQAAAAASAVQKLTEKTAARKATQGGPTPDQIALAAYAAIREYYPDLVDAAETALADSVLAGTGKGFLDLNMADSAVISTANELAAEWAHERAAEMVGMKWVDGDLVENPNAQWAISDSTRDMIRTTVEEALSEETEMTSLVDAIRESSAFSDARAKMVARTEVVRAQVQGNFDAWKQSGLVKTVRWFISAENVCDKCTANAAAGPVEIGEEFPSGDIMPPAHPNCFCSIHAGLIQ